MAAFIDNFTGDDRFVLDYLADEVLDRQPDHLRDFVLRTSVLDRLSGPLCDAVTGATGGKVTLEELDRANLFLVALDDRRQWYRYHHLFADVVRARLLDEQPGLVAELHLRASDWFDRHGEPAAAIRHALAGGHVARAAQLVELAAPATRMSRLESTLRGWLESLPDEMYDDRPVLLLSLIGARMATGDNAGVADLLDRAERWLHSQHGRTPIVFDTELFDQLEPFVEVHRAGLALLAGDFAGTVEHATRVLALVDPSDRYRIGAASALVGLAHWSQGDLDEACRRYTDAVDCFVAAGYVSDVLGCSLGLADILIAQGRLHDARRVYEAGLSLAQREGVVRGTADMHVGLAELAIEWGRLDEAERHLHAADDLGEAAGLPQHPYRWRTVTAHLHEAIGDLGRAVDLLSDAERVYNTDYFPPIRPPAAVRARVQIAAGDLDAASRWAADRRLAVDDEPRYVSEYEQMVFARLLLATTDGPGSRAAAITLLDRLLAAAEAGRREASIVQLLALSALAHEADGVHPAALAALDQALARAEPEGFVRTLLEAGPAIVGLLREPVLSADAARHARRVLAATAPVNTAPPVTPMPRPASGARSFEELSGRELDVLRLLRSDLSGPEIARTLHVSVNTLRTHTKSIYTKLGATNRREAVRIAGERDL